MTREAQIRQTAAEWLRYNHHTCTQDMLVEAFRCGAEWADKHQTSPWISVEERMPEKVHEGDMWGQVLINKDGFTREATYHFELGKFEVVIGKEGRYIEPDYWMPMPKV